MRDSSHTLIAGLRVAVNTWRKREGWSRETVTEALIAHYVQCSGEVITSIRFEPMTQDAYERTKVNADRVFRWLDDDSKDNNLLPANLIPFFVAALPMDLRIDVAQDCLGLTGLTVRAVSSNPDLSILHAVQQMAKETGEGISALVGIDSSSSLECVQAAHGELVEAHSATLEALQVLEGILSHRAKGVHEGSPADVLG